MMSKVTGDEQHRRNHRKNRSLRFRAFLNGSSHLNIILSQEGLGLGILALVPKQSGKIQASRRDALVGFTKRNPPPSISVTHRNS